MAVAFGNDELLPVGSLRIVRAHLDGEHPLATRMRSAKCSPAIAAATSAGSRRGGDAIEGRLDS